MNENQNGKKPVVTVRNIMRTLAMLCIAFVFCPSFLVSCSGQTMEFGTMDLVMGLEKYGQKMDPYPALIICLVLPAAVLAVLFVKTIAKSILLELQSSICQMIKNRLLGNTSLMLMLLQ